MAAAQLFSGTGDPNGVVFARPGDLYQDESSPGAVWIKETGVATSTGWAVLATGPAAFVFGAGAGSAIQNNGSGNASTGVDSTVCGQNNQLTGEASFAEGTQNVETVVGAGFNHLEGFQNTISCDQNDGAGNNHVEGTENTLSGNGLGTAVDFNHVEGFNNNLTPSTGFTCEFNHVEGSNHSLSITSGGAVSFNHVEGDGNTLLVNGGDLEFTHIEGVANNVTSTTADTDDSHIEGFGNTVTDADASHIEGVENVVSVDGGTANHIEGNRHTVGAGAEVNFAHVEGNQNTVTSTGLTNHVEGDHNSVTGTGAFNHVEGDHNAISGSATSNHVEGSRCSSTTNQAHVEGSRAVATRQTQHVKASGRFAIDGDAQASKLVSRGSTPGLAANESVELKYGDAADQFLTLEDGKYYTFDISAVAVLNGGGTTAMFRATTIGIFQEGGVATLVGSGVIANVTNVGAGAASWTLTASAGAAPSRLILTFATGVGVTAAVRVVATLRWTEVARA